MPKAIWEGKVIAESDDYHLIEGNVYFPRETIKSEYFTESDTKTHCGWKGEASYFNINVNGKVNKDAAWFYSEPFEAASKIKDYVAFWKGVKVE